MCYFTHRCPNFFYAKNNWAFIFFISAENKSNLLCATAKKSKQENGETRFLLFGKLGGQQASDIFVKGSPCSWLFQNKIKCIKVLYRSTDGSFEGSFLRGAKSPPEAILINLVPAPRSLWDAFSLGPDKALRRDKQAICRKTPIDSNLSQKAFFISLKGRLPLKTIDLCSWGGHRI